MFLLTLQIFGEAQKAKGRFFDYEKLKKFY